MLQNWTKSTGFVCILDLIFYGVPREKTVYTMNIWFNLTHFFEQDHLLNLVLSGVYAERWPKCERILK